MNNVERVCGVRDEFLDFLELISFFGWPQPGPGTWRLWLIDKPWQRFMVVILDHMGGKPLEGIREGQGSAEVPEKLWLSPAIFRKHDVVLLTLSRNVRGLVQRLLCRLGRPSLIAGSIAFLDHLTG